MIKAKALTKQYGSRRAISDVSFTINKGEVVGFLGPNGAGKTTTMKILTGYMAPNKGEVYLDGINIFKEPFSAKKKLGYLPEAPPVYTDMIAEDYLKYVAKLKLCPKDKISKLVESAIEKVGLQEVRKRLIQNLSKGFKQRVGLAQALVSDPEILILDEPTVGLDPKQVIEIRAILKQLKGKHTIILSTHILSEAQMTCDRVIIINEGRIITEESLSALSQKMRVKRQIILKVKKRTDHLISSLKNVKGVLSVESNEEILTLNAEPESQINEEVAKVVISSDCGLIELREHDFNLEDVFIRLTGKKD
ncbi:MAG: ABC transporter ATP-binding protein [Bdellovibrionaceae bacterium]|nr:ABC transporter ATP-binding protein [Pseudobdellovibrionaceae bacterium]